jgi:hypothetical protein
MKKQRFPAGWDDQRVKRLIAELGARTDEVLWRRPHGPVNAAVIHLHHLGCQHWRHVRWQRN